MSEPLSYRERMVKKARKTLTLTQAARVLKTTVARIRSIEHRANEKLKGETGGQHE